MQKTKYLPPEQIKINGVPAVIVDPHHEVFFFWALDYKSLAERGSAEPAQLIHIDRHADNSYDHTKKLPENFPEIKHKRLWRYTQTLNIGAFIIPAEKAGIVGPNRIWFDPSRPPWDVRVYPVSSVEKNKRDCSQVLKDAKRYNGLTWWDIDVDAFDCIKKGQRLGEYGTITSRMEETEEFLREMPKPRLITIALSQTPETYVDPKKVGMLKDKTIDMLARLTG